MEMGGNFCQILEVKGGLLLRDGEYGAVIVCFMPLSRKTVSKA